MRGMLSRWSCLLFLVLLSSCKDKAAQTEALEWEDELSLAPDRPLFEIAGDPQKMLYAVGNGVYRHEGNKWHEVSFDGRPRVLNAVSTAGNDLWAVGKSSAAVHFDGHLWVVERVGGEGSLEDLVDVVAWPSEVWAISKDDVWRRKGGAWQAWKLPELKDKVLTAIWGPSPDKVFVATEKAGVASYDGKAWRLWPLGGEGVKLHSVHGSSANDVWVVGERPDVTAQPVAFHYDGATFTQTPIPTEGALSSVHARGPQEAWAAGDRGTLVKWNGSVWHAVTGLPPSPVIQVFAPAGGPVYVNVNRRRIARAR